MWVGENRRSRAANNSAHASFLRICRRCDLLRRFVGERTDPGRAPRPGCGIALPGGIPIGPASVFRFVVKQTGGREPVQGSSKGTSLSGRELVWRVGLPVNAGLGTVSPQTPKPPGRDRASYGGAYEQIPRRADPELRPSALGKSGAAGGQGRRVLASGRD